MEGCLRNHRFLTNETQAFKKYTSKIQAEGWESTGKHVRGISEVLHYKTSFSTLLHAALENIGSRA